MDDSEVNQTRAGADPLRRRCRCGCGGEALYKVTSRDLDATGRLDRTMEPTVEYACFSAMVYICESAADVGDETLRVVRITRQR